MKYTEVFGSKEPKLQIGQVQSSEQNGRVHSLAARLIGADGTPLREGTIKTFIPLAEIEVLDAEGTVDTTVNRLSSNGKWLVTVGGNSGINDFDGLNAK